MASMQHVISTDFRGISIFKEGGGFIIRSFDLAVWCIRKNRGRKMFSGERNLNCEDPPSCVTMEEYSLAPSLSTFECIFCRKKIASHGGLSYDALKNPHPNEANQARTKEGTRMEQHKTTNPYKARFLGKGINALSGKMNDDGSSYATWFSSFPAEVQTYLKYLEAQIRTLRGGNYELKCAFTHLFSLVETTNAEVGSSSSKISGQVSNLAENFEKGCPCSVNLEARITAVHSSAKLVEGKIDNMHTEIKNLSEDIRGVAGRTSVESANL